ncbi:MAG: hypothetical protein WC891_01240 [Actinomycetota bacterium]
MTETDRKKPLAGIMALFIGFTVVAVVWTYPLVAHFDKGIPVGYQQSGQYKSEGLVASDSLEQYYYFWNFQQSHGNPKYLFADNYQYSISDAKPLIHFWGLPTNVLFAFLSILGAIAAYNLIFLLSIPAAGVSMYALVRYYTKSVQAGIAAGLAFSLAPYFLSKLYVGHLYSLAIFLVPLAIFWLEKAFDSKRLLFGLLSGVSALLIALTDPSLSFYFFIFIMLYVVFRLSKQYRDGESLMAGIKSLSIFFGLAALGAVFLLITKFIAIDKSFISGGRPWASVAEFSPRLANLFIKQWYGNVSWEKNIYMSVGALSFTAGIYLFDRLRAAVSRAKERRVTGVEYFYIFVLIISATLALGASLDSYFPVYRFLFDRVPLLNYSRTPARIMVLGHLSLAVLLGFAVMRFRDLTAQYFSGKEARTGSILFNVVMLTVVALLLFDYFPPPARISVLPARSPVYEFVKKNAKSGKVLNIPIAWHYASTYYEYYLTISQTRMVNGRGSLVPETWLQALKKIGPAGQGLLDDKVYGELKKLRVKYIVVYPKEFNAEMDPPFAEFRRNLEFSGKVKYITRESDMILYELN